jgi:hypothetical protein
MLAPDKIAHFWAGLVIAALAWPASYAVAVLTGWAWVHGPWSALAAAVAAGIAKEAYDATGRGTVEALDAVATAAGYGVIIALPAVIGFLMADISIAPPGTIGAVNLPAFGLVVAMTLVTAPWGAALAHRMDPKPLKRVFGFFLILVALNMLRKVVLG